jgi:hypothetical protein
MIHEGWWIALDLEGSDLGLVEISSWHFTGVGEEIKLRKPRKTLVMMLDNPAEIRTEHLPNTSTQCYLQTNLLGIFKYWINIVNTEKTTQFVTSIYDRVYN